MLFQRQFRKLWHIGTDSYVSFMFTNEQFRRETEKNNLLSISRAGVRTTSHAALPHDGAILLKRYKYIHSCFSFSKLWILLNVDKKPILHSIEATCQAPPRPLALHRSMSWINYYSFALSLNFEKKNLNLATNCARVRKSFDAISSSARYSLHKTRKFPGQFKDLYSHSNVCY